MSFPAASIFFMTMAALLAGSRMAAAGEPPATPTTVIVELFTSEGCSSCPPADALLSVLSKPAAVEGALVVPLELHVDYWNHLGWADRFSSKDYSRRQQDYAGIFGNSEVYTPQMIVDGTQEFVGSDQRKAVNAIARAARKPKGTVALLLSAIAKDGGSAECDITISKIPDAAGGSVLLAITEDGLSTDVARGENGGRTLHHAAVVRSLASIAAIKSGGASPFSQHMTIDLDPSWRVAKLHVVVFVQNEKTGSIVAAGAASF